MCGDHTSAVYRTFRESDFSGLGARLLRDVELKTCASPYKVPADTTESLTGHFVLISYDV